MNKTVLSRDELVALRLKTMKRHEALTLAIAFLMMHRSEIIRENLRNGRLEKTLTVLGRLDRPLLRAMKYPPVPTV